MINRLLILVLFLVLPQSVGATVYYIDPSAGSDANDGLTTGTAFNSWNQFANNARSAGDIAFIRRGTASTTNVAVLSFTSDGTANNPIIMSADYDNIWGDFATSTQTYTPVPGTKTMTANATITDIAANDWVYVEGDCFETPLTTTKNTCEFAYEVAGVSGTTLTLYLPYKGMQTSAGLVVRIMPDAPIMGNTTDNINTFTINTDDFWYFKGLEVRSTGASGSITNAVAAANTSAEGIVLEDFVLQTNGITAAGINNLQSHWTLNKFRFFGGIQFLVTADTSGVFIKDSLIDCNNVASSAFTTQIGYYNRLDSVEITRCVSFVTGSAVGFTGMRQFYGRNVSYNNVYAGFTGSTLTSVYNEDAFSIPGLNSFASNLVAANNTPTTTQSTTTNLRIGGGSKNLLVIPPSGTANTGISTARFPYSYLKLFEYPFYSDGSSKTYTTYFNATTTAHFTANPTASELWVECDYYATNSATNANRVVKKSTGTVDFAGLTTWQSIAITCDPAAAGILYLRAYYGKPVEAGKSNWFMVDPTVEAS